MADLFIVIDSHLSLPVALHRLTSSWLPLMLLDYCLKQDYNLDNTKRFSVYNYYPCTNLLAVVWYLVSSFYLSSLQELLLRLPWLLASSQDSLPYAAFHPDRCWMAFRLQLLHLHSDQCHPEESRLFHDWTDPPVALTSLARCNGCGKCMLMHADLAQL
jgi:hypothetical protein